MCFGMGNVLLQHLKISTFKKQILSNNFVQVGKFNTLTPGTFWQNSLFWTFSAWIWAKFSSNLHKKAFKYNMTACMPSFPLALLLDNYFDQVCAEIKISRFLTLIFRLFSFLNFFAFPFSPFLIFLLQLLTLFWACFQFKNFQESIINTENSYHRAAKCS